MHSEGRQLGHYRLIQRIGSGGMGEVYLAEDTRISRQVAIKIVRSSASLYPDPATTQDMIRLFQRELRAITMLDHPAILPLFDFGEENVDNTIITYMVTPFRQEGSLADWLQKQRGTQKLTPGEVAHFMAQAADALQHAHDHGLVHQDVKPSNFLVRSRPNAMLPDLLLADFGIARVTTATASQTIRGTPAFMAPEQWEGRPQPATDQYALATMAYLLLTGSTPFSGRMEQVMRQHFMTQPLPPSSHLSTLPPMLDAVMLRALAKLPEQRFPSVTAFAQAFQQAVQSPRSQNAAFTTSQHIPALPASQPHIVPEPFAPPRELPPTATSSSAGFPPIDSTTPIHHAYRPLPDTSLPPPPPPSELLPGAKPPADRSPRHTWRVPTLIGLIALIIISGVVGLTGYQYHINQLTTDAHATATAQVTATDQAIAAATTQAHLTATAQVVATAQAYATATAQAIANNPYPSYLPGKGTIALIDPLNQANYWSVMTSTVGGACSFTNGAYHVRQTNTGYYMNCNDNQSFSNFALEVQATIIQGDCSGLVFRAAGSVGGALYYFQVCQTGSYKLVKYLSDSNTTVLVWRNNTNTNIKTGLNQQNTLAVLARGNIFRFYVNQQQIDEQQDNSYTEGFLGFLAYPQFNNITEVAYSNARVWTF